jgi:hypothetical protein
VKKVGEQSARIHIERFATSTNSTYIKPALAALVFGDEGLRTAQPFGNIYFK